MPAPVTGRRETRDGEDLLVIERTIDRPVEEVWATLTRPERLKLWIGTWSGDPRSGRVDFAMTAEGADAPAEPQVIDVCDPPSRLRVRSHPSEPEQSWILDVRLRAARSGGTLVDFAQVLTPAIPLDMVGPGWEYYLDRLVAACAGDSVADSAADSSAEVAAEIAAIDWADYEPLMADYSARLGGAVGSGA